MDQDRSQPSPRGSKACVQHHHRGQESLQQDEQQAGGAGQRGGVLGQSLVYKSKGIPPKIVDRD